ncbi:MAG TPA: hypothetical protein VN193_01590 [Candidatus Angelobacter sp.]|jgi:hypothetical protein|nr:hypothetical protein [Candidatus Angelobacter sp.]
MTETTNQGTAATVASGSSLVIGVYNNLPCLAQSGGAKMVYDAIVNFGLPGPAVMFWQASAWTQSAPAGLKAQPLINGQPDQTLGTAAFLNASAIHGALLRRRALMQPLPQGESMVSVVAANGVITDRNDTVNMAVLDISDISTPPQVRLSQWGTAVGSNNLYTTQSFISGGGPLLVSLAATAWSKPANNMIGGLLYLDNQPIAYAQIWANQPNSHICLVGGDRVLNVGAGGHTLKFLADTQSTIDTNDVWSLSVIEMAPGGPSKATQLLNNNACQAQSGGGLVASAPYQATGGVQMICLWLSGYSAKAGQTLQARVLVDGNPVGTLQIFANQAETHMLLCGGDIASGSMPPGQHTIQVVAGSNLVTDQNDRCSLTVLEVFP